jgi:ribosomal 30S subunit maturation factor RimM
MNMKKSAKSMLAAGVVPLLLAPALGLADHHESGQAMPQEQHGAAQHGEARGEAYEHRTETKAAGHEKFLSQQEQDQFSADDLIGQTLMTQDDEELGEITDVLLDRDGQVAGLIVSVRGDFAAGAGAAGQTEERHERDAGMEQERQAGMAGGEREIALSWDAIELQMEEGEPVARANIDRQTLEQAQEFESRTEAGFTARAEHEQHGTAATREREAAEGTYERERETTTAGTYERERAGTTAGAQEREYERHEREGTMAGTRERERDATAGAATTERDVERQRFTQQERFITRQEMDHFTADRLIGSSVRGIDDEEIGQISDLLIDRDGNVAGVVVGVGGFLGIGERDVALSWDAIELTTDEDGEPVARVDVDQETLENAPEFEERDDGGVW